MKPVTLLSLYSFSFLILFFGASLSVSAQSTGESTQTTSASSKSPTQPKIPEDLTLDLATMRISGTFPFDIPFEVCGIIPDTIFEKNPVKSLSFYLARKKPSDQRSSYQILQNEREEEKLSELKEKGLATQVELDRLTVLQEDYLDWKELLDFRLSPTIKKQADSSPFCIPFPPLPPHTDFVLKLKLGVGMSPKQINALSDSLDKSLLIELKNLFGGNLTSAPPIIQLVNYQPIVTSLENTLLACQEAYCLVPDLKNPYFGVPVASLPDYQTRLLNLDLRPYHLHVEEQRVAFHFNDSIAFQTLSRFEDSTEWDCAINLLRETKFPTGYDKNALLLTLTQLNRVMKDPLRKGLISKGQTALSTFPIQNIKENPISTYSPKTIKALNQNLQLSLTQLARFKFYLEQELLGSAQRRAALLYEVGSNKKINVSEMKGMACLSQDFQGERDSTTVQIVDANVVPQLNQLNDFLNDLLIDLTAVKKALDQLQNSLQSYEDKRAILIQQLVREQDVENSIFPIPGTTGLDFETRNKYLITADFGFAGIPKLQTIAPYAGINFNFRALNRNAHYRLWRFGFKIKKPSYHNHKMIVNTLSPFHKFTDHIGKKSSLVLGVVPYNLAANHANYANLWSSSGNSNILNLNLLTGYGLRISDGVRWSVGAIWLKQADGNQLVSPQKISTVFYSSLSLDLDLVKYGKNVFSFFNGIPLDLN